MRKAICVEIFTENLYGIESPCFRLYPVRAHLRVASDSSVRNSPKIMAIYHCSIKPVSRAAGRSATAASAYRAGEKIVDQRTGQIHDYTRRSGVESAELVFPDNVAVHHDRASLWNAAEQAERRKDARVAREIEIALPDELTAEQRKELAVDFAHEVVKRYGVVADVCIHKPGKHGDQRNHHAHILLTTRTMDPDGSLSAKSDLELEDKKLKAEGKKTGKEQVKDLRAIWEQRCNLALQQAGHTERIDHRSLVDQYKATHTLLNPNDAAKLALPASVHLGPAATAMERRGLRTNRGAVNELVAEYRAIAHEKRERRTNPKAAREARWAADIREEAEWLEEQANMEPPANEREAEKLVRKDALIKFRADAARAQRHVPYGCSEEQEAVEQAVKAAKALSRAQERPATSPQGQPKEQRPKQPPAASLMRPQRQNQAQPVKSSSMPQEQSKAKPAAGQGKPSLGQDPQQDPAARPRPEVLSPLEELARTLREAGLVIEGDPMMDGKWHAVSVERDKPGSQSGRYCATMTGDHPNGTWQNWKTGEQGKWIYTGQILTEEALQELRRQAEMTSEKQQRQQDQKQEPIPSPQKQPTSAELRAELDRIEAEIARLRPRYPGEAPHVRRAIEEHKRTKEEYRRQDVDVFHIRREFESLNQHVAAHPIKSRLDGSAEELKQRKKQLEEEQKKLERLQWKLKETEKAKEKAILDEQKKIAAEQTPERTARLESLEKQAKGLREQLHAAREREWRQERQQGRERDGGFSR